MSCAQAAVRDRQPHLSSRSAPVPRRIALVGNANVGKSVLFGRLTGQYAVVSNYPGTTVAVTQGRALDRRRSLRPHRHAGRRRPGGVLSEDELVSRRIARGRRDSTWSSRWPTPATSVAGSC